MIYVDDYEGKFGRMIMCHMMSDTSIEELHKFAEKIGMKRDWFQDGSAPHYDLSKSKRVLAISKGAIEIETGTQEWLRVYKAAKETRRNNDNR
jgi:hypothetical protein